jgi:hypothetical protein
MGISKLLPLHRIVIFAVLLAVQGCASSPVNITPLPKSQTETIGRATGTACGSLGLLGTAYYFVPMGLNSRVERARIRALESVPGATNLQNVEISEDWYWWIIGTVRCTTISGDAIKEVTP